MTDQISEMLLFNGKRYSVLKSPLDQYFELNPPRPKFASFSTANHKGYDASWEIIEGRLFLTEFSSMIEVDGPVSKSLRKRGGDMSWWESDHTRWVTLNDIFNTQDDKLFANWVAGNVRMAEFLFMGSYSGVITLQMKKGIVTGVREKK